MTVSVADWDHVCSHMTSTAYRICTARILGPLALILLGIHGPCQAEGEASATDAARERHRADLVEEVQRRAFGFFTDHVNAANGLVRDRSTEDAPASIAGTGFALPIWAVGAERGWISRDRALGLTLALLRFLQPSAQGEEDDAGKGHRGFYYHFLDMESGRRVWSCELSTIDTALLLAGIRFVRGYYDRDEEREVRELADAITARVDWNWLTLRDGGRFEDSVSLGWRPETGAIPIGWVGYNEALILYLLAAGSGWNGAPAAYRRWASFYEWREPYPGLGHASFPPLFGHQYSHVFVDFRGLADAWLRPRGIDYFENSRRAVEVQRRYAQDNPGGFVGYGEHVWGLTACDGPGQGGASGAGGQRFRGYAARGTSGPDAALDDDGTLAPTAVVASIPFAPGAVLAAIDAMRAGWGDAGLWGRYGFQDAFNPTADWIAEDVLAIDQGPMVLMIENWRNGFVWRRMMADSLVIRGLDVLGFDEPPTARFEAEICAFEALDRSQPPPEDAVLFVGSSSIARWRNLAEDMAPLPVINRGFGGSQACDVIAHFDRIVGVYRPRAVVLYEGDNDVAAGCSPAEVLVRHREIIRLMDERLPGTPLFVLAIKPSPARRALWPQMQVANALLRDLCAERTSANQRRVFVDITAPMLTDGGSICGELFVGDELHLNRVGYEAWANVVQAALAGLAR